jgi:CMP-N,N'-diacetyllegionaminic acid synthase
MIATGSMREILAVIPARGGSKGIPRKNLAEITGLPLVAHSIRHALASPSITRVIVSTEDDEIAQVSRRHGAEVPFLRPRELAEDDVLDQPVFRHVLETLRARDAYAPDLVVHLRPTTPFRRIEWIEEAIVFLTERSDADSIRSVSKPGQHPYRMFTIGTDGFLKTLMQHEGIPPYLLRRQDLPSLLYYNCVLDITRPATILAKGSMTGDRILPYVIPADEVVDVDSPRDLEIARFLMERMT